MRQNRIRTVVAVLVLAAFSLCVTVPVYAQATGATVQGTMTDPSGAIIPGGKVLIKNVATGVTRDVVTNASGVYRTPNLTPGKYEITASTSGFKVRVVSEVTLTVGAEVVVNLQMQVGEVSQTVEVIGGAAADIELASSMLSHVVGATAIRELPLNGRDWTQLATLQPGVAIMVSQDTSVVNRLQRGEGVQLTISGGRPSENNYRVDGVSVNDYANTAPGTILGNNLGVDAIQEFSVLTSTFSSEYGRASGGVLNAVTRSGTNAFHGSAYYFHRNSALDARNFFDNTPKPPPFHRNQFGASVGGPIRKDRTFFFADYEGLRESLGISGASVTLSPAARNGTLGSVTPTPATITVSAAIKPYLALYPLPNGPLSANGDLGTFFFSNAKVSREDYVTGKMDHRFSEKNSASAAYRLDDGSFTSPDEFNNKLVPLDSRNQSGSLDWSHIFTPQLFHTLRLGFSRTVALSGLTLSVLNPVVNDVSLGFVPGFQPGTIVASGGLTTFTGGLGGGSGFAFTTYQAYDNLFLTKGVHSLKIGANVERDQANSLEQGGGGQFNFGSVRDFLLANPSQFSALLPGSDVIRGIRQTIVGAYVQDDVRWRPNLTVNLGVRYEMVTVPREVNGKLAKVQNLTDAQATVVGSPYNNQTLRNFEPRVGFAWDPFRDGKTSVRGGLGIFDVLPLNFLFVNLFARTPPFFKSGVATTTNIPAAFPHGAYNLLTPATFRTIYLEPNPKRPYKPQWNLNVQREVARNLTAAVGYVGAHGVHLPVQDQDLDVVIPVQTNPYLWPPTATSKRINENFGRIGSIRWYGYSTYHGLQASLLERFSRGLQIKGSYTWAKSIDNGTATFSNNEFLNAIGNPYPFDPNLPRGLADFDIRHNFVLNLTWELPSPKPGNGPAGWLLGGWQVGSIFQARTGAPFTVATTSDRAGIKSSSQQNTLGERPNFVGGSNCKNPTNPGNPNRYVKTECFTFPAAGTLGNLGRGTLTGPGFMNLDFSVFKNFAVPRISEGFKAQFRAEFFNVLNHTNFAMLQGRTAATIFDAQGRITATAGQILATQNPSRQIQFALKLLW